MPFTDAEQQPLPDVTIEITTPDICAVCQGPSVGEYLILAGKNTKDGNGHAITSGTVRRKLCKTHADALEWKQNRRTPKVAPDQPALPGME